MTTVLVSPSTSPSLLSNSPLPPSPSKPGRSRAPSLTSVMPLFSLKVWPAGKENSSTASPSPLPPSSDSTDVEESSSPKPPSRFGPFQKPKRKRSLDMASPNATSTVPETSTRLSSKPPLSKSGLLLRRRLSSSPSPSPASLPDLSTSPPPRSASDPAASEGVLSRPMPTSILSPALPGPTTTSPPKTVRHSPSRRRRNVLLGGPSSEFSSEGEDDDGPPESPTSPIDPTSSPSSSSPSPVKVPRSPFAPFVPSAVPPDVTPYSRSIPVARTSTASPPPSDAVRQAARAEALAKLTEPSPKTFPAPKRPLPRLPLRDQSGSDSNEEGGRVSSEGEDSTGLRKLETPTAGLPRKKTSLRAKGKSSSSSVVVFDDLESEEGMLWAVRKVKRFLEAELGSRAVAVRGDGIDKYEAPERVEEELLWAGLRDGLVLCRLVNHLTPLSPPISAHQFDRRGLPSSITSNLTAFLSSASSLYSLAHTELFSVADMTSRTRFGMRRVLRTLLTIENRSSGANTSRLVSSLPIDINLRGRALRARSPNPTVSGAHSVEGSGTSSDVLCSSPSNSSRFTDYSFTARESGRSSLELPLEMDRERGTDWTGAPPMGKIYGDRRMAESAVDVLSIVEEDESGSVSKAGRAHLRFSTPLALPREPGSPSKRHRSFRLSDVASQGAGMKLERGALLPTPQRRRHSSDMTRPSPLAFPRSVSLPADPPTQAELEELASLQSEFDKEVSRPESRSSNVSASTSPSQKTVTRLSSSVPFPSVSPIPTVSPSSAPSRRPDIGLGFPPIASPGPRQQHNRWNSELYIEKPLGNTGLRSRHESIDFGDREAAEEGSGRAVKAKLVFRENGKPALTYQLGECIGRGQFGAVYRGLNLKSGRYVAVKRIQLEGKSEDEINQLLDEVNILQSLDHPAIVRYEGVIRTEHYINILLEFVDQGSLHKTLKYFPELPESLIADYVVKILEGLDYLHGKKVVHCDLKAANILNTKNGNIKLGDFGVSLNLNAVQNIRRKNDDVAGTPNWMAPEVIELKGASTASDIWSLGCVVIELLTGRPPYAKMTALSAMFRIVEDPHPPIPERCSPELSDFLLQCFAKDPRKRPTANDLFHHEWLLKAWEADKDTQLHPQNSIPFLRRLSSDQRRPEWNFEESSSESDSYFTHSPVHSTPSPRFPEVARRLSMNSAYYAAAAARSEVELVLASPEPMSRVSTSEDIPSLVMEEPARPHVFVKTTFSKPIECRCCLELTKRHSVLCKDCGWIAHARCADWAPLPCDLRSQLARSSKPLFRRSVDPPATVSTPLSGLAVIITDFAKLRRPKTFPPPPFATADNLTSSTPVTDTPTTDRRSFSDRVRSRTRSPNPSMRTVSGESQPVSAPEEIVTTESGGSSRSRNRPRITSQPISLGSHPEGHRSALDLLLKRKPSGGFGLKKPTVVDTAAGKRLSKQKSHSRSQSNPVKNKDGTDCVVQ